MFSSSQHWGIEGKTHFLISPCINGYLLFAYAMTDGKISLKTENAVYMPDLAQAASYLEKYVTVDRQGGVDFKATGDINHYYGDTLVGESDPDSLNAPIWTWAEPKDANGKTLKEKMAQSKEIDKET